MTKPIESGFKAVTSAVTRVVQPLTSALSRAVTAPGTGADRTPHMPGSDNATSVPGKVPTFKPSGRGMQSSFLSGVAGGAAATGLAGGGGFAQGGKSLLGS